MSIEGKALLHVIRTATNKDDIQKMLALNGSYRTVAELKITTGCLSPGDAEEWNEVKAALETLLGRLRVKEVEE